MLQVRSGDVFQEQYGKLATKACFESVQPLAAECCKVSKHNV